MFHTEILDKGTAVMTVNQHAVRISENEKFKKAFDELLGKDIKIIVVDMSRADFISSVVIASLIYVLKRIRQKGGRLALCGLKGNVKEVFDITNLEKIFEIYDSKQEAIESVR
jgi:anti-anti-sigma factor